MRGMTLRRIANACGGILHEKDGMGDQEVTFVTTDSRQASGGCLFAAIRGAKVDGHRFIPSVYEKGAICVITEEALPEDAKGSWIKVISTLQALKDIAERTGLDISTISRVSNEKYAQTRWGIFKLRFFFSEGVKTESGEALSNRRMKVVLKEIIDAEDKRKPLSDETIKKMMEERGYPIARRTVTKYREQLGIPVARLRG